MALVKPREPLSCNKETLSLTAADSGKRDTGKAELLVVIEHKGEMHPRIVIEDSDGKILDFHYLPAKARIEVAEGQEIMAGHMLARQPREVSGSSDIVGGLPRVTEIFEARKPKDAVCGTEVFENAHTLAGVSADAWFDE